MPDNCPTSPTPVALDDCREPALATGQQPLAGRRWPLWLPTWLWVAVLAGADVITTVVGLVLGHREANPAATIVGGVSVFLAIKLTLMAVLCWRWRRLGEKHWSTLSRLVVLGIMAGVVCWNIIIIARA